MKTLVDVPNNLIEMLALIGEREKTSRSAIIREAIKEFINRYFHNQTDIAFGIWKKKNLSSDEYLSEIRKEWE